jgi:hypothetical protein
LLNLLLRLLVKQNERLNNTIIRAG